MIHEHDGLVGQIDTLVLEDLTPDDVRLTHADEALIINVLVDGGQIQVADWYGAHNNNRLEKLVFADGTEWTGTYMNHLGAERYGSDAADVMTGMARHWDRLYGQGGDDTLTGDTGNDRLYGGDGNDSLDGGEGADYLDGGAGDDTLTTYDHHGGTRFRGGTGNDTLNGSRYDDTYYYRLGDGRDVIDERGSYTGVVDKLVLEDLNHDQLWFERAGNDLVLSVIGTDDQVTIDDWYRSSKNHVELFEASDAMALSNNNIDQLVNAMAAFNKPAAGETELSTQLRDDLSPVLAASWQSGS